MMSDYHFGLDDDADRTILRPKPGGRRVGTQYIRATRVNQDKPFKMDLDRFVESKSNPLCALSFTLFSLVTKLQGLAFHHSMDTLKDRLVREVKEFKYKADQHCSADQVRVASYFLCALIDETILNTPWGRQSDWGHHGLLIMFHHEAQGGEKFFQLLKPMMDRPTTHLHLLEMAYYCLSLGFQGKYRILPDGLRHIDNWRQNLYRIIDHNHNTPDQDLSLNWEGLYESRGRLMRHIPVWVIGVIAGSLIMLIYLGFAYTINHSSDRAFKHLMSIAAKQSKTADPPLIATEQSSPLQKQTVTIKTLLAEEIGKNMVSVVKGPTLRISNAFGSGSDRMNKRYLPILTKLADHLRDDLRRIEVVGHTDNQPIFSARHPSNWHLSKARAQHVAKILGSEYGLKDRVSFAGQADTKPLVANDTAQNRAINRRIEIHIR